MAIIGTLPYTISDGQVIDAVPVQANFNWILSQVNANAIGVAPGASGNALISNGTIWTSVSLTSQLTAYATLASPNFTGSPTAPTGSRGESDNLLATNEFATQIGIGTAQSAWTLYSSRAAGTVYTNYANGPLCVSVGVTFFASGDSAELEINGASLCKLTAAGAGQQNMWCIVPYEGSYELVLTGSAALTASTWREF